MPGRKYTGATEAKKREHPRPRAWYPNLTFLQDDTLSYIVDKVPDNCRDVRTISLAILMLSFGGVQTSAVVSSPVILERTAILAYAGGQSLQTLTNVMYQIAANPEYARILREEVQETTSKYGWSKLSINKMHRMDSFLREIHRFYGTHGSGKQLVIASPDVLN